MASPPSERAAGAGVLRHGRRGGRHASLNLNPDDSRASETVWNDNGPDDSNGFGFAALGATGSGCSTIYTAQTLAAGSPRLQHPRLRSLASERGRRGGRRRRPDRLRHLRDHDGLVHEHRRQRQPLPGQRPGLGDDLVHLAGLAARGRDVGAGRWAGGSQVPGTDALRALSHQPVPAVRRHGRRQRSLRRGLCDRLQLW